MTIDICLAGATGWAGSEFARGIARTDDIALVAAVARKAAGRTLVGVHRGLGSVRRLMIP